MPMDRKKYPPDWEAISLAVRERAGFKCQWCGVANGAVGARDIDGEWHDEAAIHSMPSDEGYALFNDGFPKIIKIILTVHHIGVPHADGRPGSPHDKMDCREENLVALCQRCHLNADRAHHVAARLKTLARRKAAREAERLRASHQLSLFTE